MKKIIVAVIVLTAIISHVYSAEFECTWNENKGSLFSMIPGQKPQVTGQAWPLMHHTFTADNAEEAKSLCRRYVLEKDFNNDKKRFDENTKNWDAKLIKPEEETGEWHCHFSGSSTKVPLKIIATGKGHAKTMCEQLSYSHGGKNPTVTKLS